MNQYHYALVLYRSGHEQANVGVILWQPTERDLLFLLCERSERFVRFFWRFDEAEYSRQVQELRERLKGIRDVESATSLNEVLDLAFPDPNDPLTHSEIRGGISPSPAARVQQLYGEYVRGF